MTPEWVLPPGSSYDELPYPSRAFPATHPDRLCTVARLSGMNPTPVEKCRVLEIGCATGGNIIPMAEALPQSTFVGLDYSERQIAMGNETVSALGLKNIELLHKDILDVGPELGSFDYISAHGVYSWVPERVRDKVLEICDQRLAPNGVAYVSYNVYPGWALRRSIRQFMHFHIRNVSGAANQAAKARDLLMFLASSVFEGAPNYAGILKNEAERMRGASDAYLFHEYLEEVNEPFYFHEFAGRTAAHGLQFLAEADPRSSLAQELKPDAREKLQSMPGIIEREQHLDFLRNNAFRQTLLCHQDISLVPMQIQSRRGPELFRGLYVSSPAQAKSPGNESASPPWVFVNPSGQSISTSNPGVRSILNALAAVFPMRVLFDELATRVASSGVGSASDAATLVFDLYARQFADFFPRQIDYVATPSAHPMVRHSARLQAVRGENEVNNMLHIPLPLDPTARVLIPMLDGSRSLDQIVDELARRIDPGTLGRPISAGEIRAMVQRDVEKLLTRFAENAMLIL